jgi:hypothetical protein
MAKVDPGVTLGDLQVLRVRMAVLIESRFCRCSRGSQPLACLRHNVRRSSPSRLDLDCAPAIRHIEEDRSLLTIAIGESSLDACCALELPLSFTWQASGARERPRFLLMGRFEGYRHSNRGSIRVAV